MNELKPLLKTNLDTNFLKLIAIVSMVFDHVGSAFFPEYPIFRWIGRLAFPIFCYCMTVGLLAMWGFKERKWWLFAAGTLVLGLFNFDYGYTGILLMLIFYLCRQKPVLGAALYVVSYIPAAFFGSGLDDPNALIIGGYAIGFEIFALFALPLIFSLTSLKPKIPKWFFYAFYPAHLAVIALLLWVRG